MCGDSCGWMAAAGSALAFGTFAVPIKGKAAQSVDIDPLVFQSYKTFVCFVTSWMILGFGEKFTFTPWGIVSGLFWVPAGIATVYAVKTAGLAIGVGIASSFIVLVSFIWGIFIFDEPIHSKTGASFAILCLIFGLFGMSFFSSHAVDDNSAETSFPTNTTSLMEGTAIYRDFESAVATSAEDPDETDTDCTNTTERSVIVMSRSPSYSDNLNAEWHSGQETSSSPLPSNIRTDHSPESENITVQVHVWGQKISKRRLGMMSAAFCGIWGGSIMVPMKFCQSDTKGTHYLLSFAIGAAIVNIAVWMIRFIFHVAQERSFARGFQQLPSFHVRVMWLAGLTSGLLWSIGNFFSMISVFYLGEGVGYPLVQTSIFVAGLWGIFYFKEVRGRERICRWLLSATSTVFGILLLSYEHHKS